MINHTRWFRIQFGFILHKPRKNIKLSGSGLWFLKLAVQKLLQRKSRFLFSVQIRQLIKEILHCKCYMYVGTEPTKAQSLCSSFAALLTSPEDAGTWDLWTSNLWVTETGGCRGSSLSRTTWFSLQTNASVAANLTAVWFFSYIQRGCRWNRQGHRIILCGENSCCYAHASTQTCALTLEVSFKW